MEVFRWMFLRGAISAFSQYPSKAGEATVSVLYNKQENYNNFNDAETWIRQI